MRVYWNCVRCETALLEGQPFQAARARGKAPNASKELGVRHKQCPREAIVAKQRRDNERNRATQIRDSARTRQATDELPAGPPGPTSTWWKWRTEDGEVRPIRHSHVGTPQAW